MNRFVRYSTLLIFLGITFFANARSKVDRKKLDAYFSQMVEEWGIPSMSIGIVKDGELVFAQSYGVLEEGKTQTADPNTLYAIASNSKAFTSAMLGMLVQEGKISWDDKVKAHLPYFAVYDPWVSDHVTIRDLLSHRVGLGTFSGDVMWYKSDLSAEEIIQRAKFLPKAFDFRAGYGYSNLMYITAGEIIKKVTGKTWGENVHERIFKPLGMDRSITSLADLDKMGNFATPHMLDDGKNIPIEWEDWEEIGAMGGIISSVNDVSKWMIFNLNHGIQGEDTLLTAATRNIIWTPHNNFVVDHTSKDADKKHFSGYGLGWGLSEYDGKLRVSHTGGYDGMITAINLIPDENLGVVVLTNGLKTPYMAASYYALDYMLNNETKDWSSIMLNSYDAREKKDTRIEDRKAARVLNTVASIPLNACAGDYKSDIYGSIAVTLENDELRLSFEHSNYLSATLKHWHYDVWEIIWDHKHAWFSFGTVKFNADNNLKVTGLEFDVPNNDIFFEELKPYKVMK